MSQDTLLFSNQYSINVFDLKIKDSVTLLQLPTDLINEIFINLADTDNNIRLVNKLFKNSYI